MNINKISLNLNTTIQQKEQNKQNCNNTNETNPPKSLYETSGTQVAFCAVVQPKDSYEEECVKILRKARENRCRKFTEPDIQEILTNLRREPDGREKFNTLKDALILGDHTNNTDYKKAYRLENIYCETISKNIFKGIVSEISGHQEEERLAFIAFANHDLNSSCGKGLETFISLPEDKKQKLRPFINDISNLVYNFNCPCSSDKIFEDTLGSLYDTFLILVYTEDDLLKNKSQNQINAIKLDTFHIIKESLESYQNDTKSYNGKDGKDKIINIVQSMYDYVLDDIL